MSLAGVDIERRLMSGLFWSHVGGRADELLELGVNGFIGEVALGGFGDAEVDDFWNGNAVVGR